MPDISPRQKEISAKMYRHHFYLVKMHPEMGVQSCHIDGHNLWGAIKDQVLPKPCTQMLVHIDNNSINHVTDCPPEQFLGVETLAFSASSGSKLILSENFQAWLKRMPVATFAFNKTGFSQASLESLKKKIPRATIIVMDDRPRQGGNNSPSEQSPKRS